MKKGKSISSVIIETLLIISLSLYYALGVLWTGEIITASQTRILWALILVLIFATYTIYRDFLIPNLFKKIDLHCICLAGFLFISFLSIFWADNPGFAENKFSLIWKLIVSMLLVYIFFSSEIDVRKILKSIEYGGDISILYLIAANGLSYMVFLFRTGSRLTYTGINSNGIGLIAAFSIIISVYFLTTEGFRLTSLFAIPCGLIVVLSVSKKAIFAMLFGILLLLLLNSIDNKKVINNIIKIILISLGSIITLYFLLKLPFLANVEKRIAGLLTGLFSGKSASGVDASTYERLVLLEAGKDIFYAHPLLGVGLDNARFFNYLRMYLHNNYIEIVADLGIVGFLAFYLPYFKCVKTFIKYRNTEDREFNICATLLVLTLILDFGRVSYYDLETYFYLVLFMLKSNLLIRSKDKRKLTHDYSFAS